MVMRLYDMLHCFAEEHTRAFTLVIPLISIVIPTMLRPEGLKTALQSAAAQVVPGYKLEIIVADNSPNASAREQVEAFAKTTNIDLKYISEPKAGVANVRNAALTLVSGNYIAFLDDDQAATPEWLAHMMAQCKRTTPPWSLPGLRAAQRRT